MKRKKLRSKAVSRRWVTHFSGGYDRNGLGAIVGEFTGEKLWHFSQLFLSREIWGIDALILNADYLNELQMHWKRPPWSYITSGAVEEYFVKALSNYLSVAAKHLQLLPPLVIEAGLTGIKGYSLAVANEFWGKSLQDVIKWQDEIASYDKPPWEILRPFFDQIWADCGVARTAQHQAALAKKFGG
jgi:hypothetical protein